MAHPEAEWPSQQNMLNFSRFTSFFSYTCGHNFGRTVARKSSIGGFVFAQGEWAFAGEAKRAFVPSRNLD